MALAVIFQWLISRAEVGKLTTMKEMKECIKRVTSQNVVARLPEQFTEVATLASIFTLILLSVNGTSINA